MKNLNYSADTLITKRNEHVGRMMKIQNTMQIDRHTDNYQTQ